MSTRSARPADTGAAAPVPTSSRIQSAATAGRWLLPGLIAGTAFLAVAMIGGAITTTAWAMPEAIATTLGLGAPRLPFWPAVVLVGVLMHLGISAALGAVFTAIAARLRLRGGVLILGAVIYMMVESAVSIWVVLHSILDPGTFTFFLNAIPFWASFTGRVLFGLVLGVLLAGPLSGPGPHHRAPGRV